MKREILRPETEEAWLAMRREVVTSTAATALFELSPYLTEFQLYHAMKSKLDLPFEPNERMLVGSRMQDFAADEVAREHDWEVWRADEFVLIPEIRMGSSFDYRIRDKERGEGLLEIKAVDWNIHRNTWVDEEAPEHIEIQLQHQLEVYDKFEWGVIVAFTGIYEKHLYFRDRDREFGAAIVNRVMKFWADVDAGNEPDPDFGRDGPTIKALFKGGPEALDRTQDQEFNALLAKYAFLKDEKKVMENYLEETQNEIIRRLGNHSEAYGDRYKFKVSMIKESLGRLVTAEMVGEHVGGKAAHPRCRITDLHKKQGKAA
jgi:predicted phage-related endonuclease